MTLGSEQTVGRSHPLSCELRQRKLRVAAWQVLCTATLNLVRSVFFGLPQNSQASPSRNVLGAWISNGMRSENLGLVRSDSKVFLFKLRRLKTSRSSETFRRFIPKARATRKSRVELNSVRKAPKSP